MSTPHIQLDTLKKSFGAKTILDGVSFSVARGRSLVIVGGSGSGKSVMLKCILGLLPQDSGLIYLDGENLSQVSSKAKNEMISQIGMLFQNAALFDSLPVWENIAFGLINARKIPKKKAREIALEKMRQVGLSEDVAALYPSEISGGMQKRVGFARAIASDPQMILFDEPTTGLDPIMANIINQLIVDCSKRLGATTISITHDMNSARKIADDIAMLYQGRIIWQGPSSLVEYSGNPYVDQFIHGKTEGPIELAVLKP